MVPNTLSLQLTITHLFTLNSDFAKSFFGTKNFFPQFPISSKAFLMQHTHQMHHTPCRQWYAELYVQVQQCIAVWQLLCAVCTWSFKF